MMRRSIFLYLPSLLGSLIYLARLIFSLRFKSDIGGRLRLLTQTESSASQCHEVE